MPKKKSLHRPSVPAHIKRQLYREAGNKCANPGCPNRITELHHIQEWHVYRTHDAKHMIAICPTCHTYAHHGEFRIEEATLRSWKRARRNPSNTGYLYIEAGPPPRMLMGRIYWARKDGDGAVVFRLSERNYLRFRVIPGNILIVSLAISNPAGEVVAEVRENHLTFDVREGVQFDSRPGRLRISAPATETFISRAIMDAYRAENGPGPLVVEGRLTLVDIQVLDVGTVQVEGVWVEGDRAVISHADYLSILLPGRGFGHWCGYGEVRGDKDLDNLPTIKFDGPLEVSIISAMFQSGGVSCSHEF